MNITTDRLAPILLSFILLCVTLTPLISIITPLLPTLPRITLPVLLLSLFDHLAAAAFAARYLTFSSTLPPTDPSNLYPYVLPYLPLLPISHTLLTTPKTIISTILPLSETPAPHYNPCQANFSIFISTVIGLPLTILQWFYGVPAGVSHWASLTLPILVIATREPCLLTLLCIALVACFGNVAVLAYLVLSAVEALFNDVSLSRVLLAKRGDWPSKDHENVEDTLEGEKKPLLENLRADVHVAE